jgi:hypothetical protein
LKAHLTFPSTRFKSHDRYLGALDNVPSAISAVVDDSGVAGMYGLATLLEDRHKSIGELMTVMPLI